MSKVLHAIFNSSKNPHLTYPLLLVSYSTMFSPSYISSSGSKLGLKGAWGPPSFIRHGGCSSVDFDVQGLPLLVFDTISSPSLFGIPDPIILFSSTTHDPFVLLSFPLLLGYKIFKTMSHILLLLICLILNLTHFVKRKVH